MRRLVQLYAISLAIAWMALLGLGIRTQAHHTDVVYILLLLVLIGVGSLGSLACRRWWLNSVILSAAWLLFYLVLALVHGFSGAGFGHHAKYMLVILVVTSLVGALGQWVDSNLLSGPGA